MTLALYRGLTTAAEPLIRIYLNRRCGLGKEDPLRLGERYGQASRPRPAGPLVWIHGASVGEAISVLAMIDRMMAQHPGLNVLVTTGTVTSAKLLAKRLPRGAFHQYIPIDHAGWARRFIDHWKPDLALWVESELWPNLIEAIGEAAVPLVLLNGRMSDASFQRWRRVPFLIRPLLERFALCLGQDERQTQRLVALGAPKARSIGNLKFAALPLPVDEAELARQLQALNGRKLWLAASTHQGEEAMVGAAHRLIAASHPGVLTVIVPRHPDRGAAIAEELKAQGLRVARRGAGEKPEGAEIYVADTMGELGLFYRLGGIAFMGGSLVPHGGHNPLEPALLDCAVLSGPHTQNFAAVAGDMIVAEALTEVRDAESLAGAVIDLLGDARRRRELADRAQRVAQARSGVLDAVLRELAPWIEAAERRHTPGHPPGYPPGRTKEAPATDFRARA